MAFVITLHLQASADAALSCNPVRPVTRGAHGKHQGMRVCHTDMFVVCSPHIYGKLIYHKPSANHM